ncbi:hypothetical protein B7494_g4739 [Chlorociboria aeruginascens]|nr:hypothetical protein B7494_g4739 [Chlorociboria aeruginascens]
MAERGLTRAQVQMVAWTSIAVLVGAVWFATTQSSPVRTHCRCFPGDACWPSTAAWNSFNKTVGGRLIATIPIASPCHDTFPGVSYDAEKCADIQANWPRPELHDETTHSPMAAFFANMSCDPFTPRDAQCIIGTYVPYAVNASSAEDYRATIAFATENNIRLVIRNTGHDYMGKSTGAGALALWTHHLKARSILDYSSCAYTGKAIKLGAGVQASEAQATANAEGYVVVEGDCATVGIAGGYTQGGGTSPLASKFGLAADQVLEWEVITGTGELLTASPSENPDLYWALAGGGGGTYGAVLSMTVKLHENMHTAGATLTFTESSDAFWAVLQTFLVNMPAVLQAGAVLYWQVLPGNLFYMPQAYLPDGTAEDMERLLQPTLGALKKHNIPYALTSVNFPTFQDAFYTLNPDMNITSLNLGGSLVPRSLVESTRSATSLVNAIKSVLSNGGILAGISMDVSQSPTSPNAANPSWRESLFLAFLGIVYDQSNMTANLVDQKTVTNVLDPALEKLTSKAAAYLNEADFNQPNWQQVFYGANYPKLVSIKKKYDPNDMFWGPTVVGTLPPIRVISHQYIMFLDTTNFFLPPFLFLLAITANGHLTRSSNISDGCRSIPGDISWPNSADWNALNKTVGGSLIATIPIGAPCHRFFSNIPTYDEEKCNALRNVWFLPETHLPSSSSPMAYSFSNNSCNPWLEPDAPCTIGDHIVYAINATSPSDLQHGVAFAERHNIRLSIRNTGHDYLGRSTGAHALAIWTHNLKSLEVVEYDNANYTGPAIKIGAGVLAIDAYTFASANGFMVVGGNCPTVGIAGGYTQGGGHGPLASSHGLGADQVLEWEVITADGTLVTANSTHQPDLFWALRGGGPGTYGVVVSMTVKAYPDTYASSAYFTVLDNGTNTDTIYQAIGEFLKVLPSIVDAGIYALWVVEPAGFFLMPAFGPGLHQDELDNILQPALEVLTDLNLDYEYSSSENATFLATYEALTSNWNVSDYNTGGRLIPRDLVSNNTDAVVQAIRNIGSQTLFSGVSFNVKNAVSSPDEVAVNPYFREALFNVFMGVAVNYTDWAVNIAGEDAITDYFLPPLEALTPNGGAYMNEADFQQPDFQSVFYGTHYEKLLSIKQKYDPDDVFYVKTGVGSDAWEEQPDGRLCRTLTI